MKDKIIAMEMTEWWKAYSDEFKKVVDWLNRELLRDGREEDQILNDKLNERIYNYYDLIALARHLIQNKIGGINDRLKNNSPIVSDQSDLL